MSGQAPAPEEGHAPRRTLGVLFPPLPDERASAAEFFRTPEPERDYSNYLESVCGATDDSQPVEQYDGALGVSTAFVDANQGAVGQLQWNPDLNAIYTNPGNVSGVRWATGTLIAPDLFLTAGHNFDQTGGGWVRPRDNVTGAVIAPAEIARNMRVNFNYQVDPAGNLRPEQRFPVTELVEYRLGGLDYAIVRLGGSPGTTFGTVAISTKDAAVGATVAIIGHPVGVPKRVEAGPVTDLHDQWIGYNDIDTQGGNSGSAVIQASNSRIVGVHTNGGCRATDPDSDASHNHGMRISSVIAASPVLRTLIWKPKFSDDLKLKVSDDVKLKFSDDLKSKASDDIKLKFSDDVKFKASDDIKLKFSDDGGSFKVLDDAKLPQLDKQFGDQKLPGSDGGPVWPGVTPGQPSQRPFVMANPHHSMAWARGGAPSAAEGRQQLVQQYEQLLAQLADSLAAGREQLRQLDEMYQQAVTEYEALRSGEETTGP